MSGLKKSQTNVTVGDGGKVPGSFRRFMRDFRLPLAAVVAAVFIGAVLYAVAVNNRPKPEELQAVAKSNQAAHGFNEISEEYALTRMNVAVQYAYDKKCTEAHAVVKDVTGRTNGLKPIDLKQYQKKIDSLCSGT